MIVIWNLWVGGWLVNANNSAQKYINKYYVCEVNVIKNMKCK